MFGFLKKKEAVPKPKKEGRPKVAGKKKRVMRHAGPYTPEQRRQAVEAYFKSGMSAKDFAQTWGTSEGSLYIWVKAYQEHGPKALEGASLRADAKKRGRKGIPEPLKREITQIKREHPELGTRGVRDRLFRFGGVKLSKGTVRKTLREAKIPPLPKPTKRRRRQKQKIQRFERALPMQLWQTDITTLNLARHSQRVYLTVFMDDCSRYIVSWALQLQQTKEFVMETLLSGIQRFGKPEEVLTDQGRQYFSWRGKSDFRKLLSKQGIKHVVSRAHHPETVGKCERFWETVKAEFWERVEPQDLSEARERLEHFISHYNHFRPHQGLDGMTPADRFFRAEDQVRTIIEETISKNALRLAVGEAPRKPVFLIGQIGDQPLSLHGEKGKLVLQTPDGLQRRIDYEDFGHAHVKPTEIEKGEDREHEIRSETQGISRAKAGEENTSSQTQYEVAASHATSTASESTLGNSDTGTAQASSRVVSSDHGILARDDHQAGANSAAQDPAAPSLAAVTAGRLGYGGWVTHPTQDASTAGSKEHGLTYTQGPGERPQNSQSEDRGAGEESLRTGAPDCSSSRDAGLQRCENPNGDTRGSSEHVSGGNEAQWERSADQENDGSSTDGSSS